MGIFDGLFGKKETISKHKEKDERQRKAIQQMIANKSSKQQDLDSNKILLKLTDSLEGLLIEHPRVNYTDKKILGTTSIRLTKSIINQRLRIKELVAKIIEKQLKSIDWLNYSLQGQLKLGEDEELFLIPSKDAFKGQNDKLFSRAASLVLKNPESAGIIQRELQIDYMRLGNINDGLQAIGVLSSGDNRKVLVSNEIELKILLNNISPSSNIKEDDLILKDIFFPLFLVKTILTEINFIKSDITSRNSEVLVSSFQELDEFVNKLQPKLEKIKKNQIIDRDQIKLQLINEFDKDKNGKIDIVECDDFNQLLKKNQKKIIETDKSYIQQFVQLSDHLNTRKDNIQHLYDKVKAIPNQNAFGADYNDFIKIIKNTIHSYKVLLANSLNMICALIEDDLITFYKIHGKLDKLNIFNSNYENEILNKLSNIEMKLEDVIYSINDMNNNIAMELGMLSMEIENSTNILSKHLKEIGSEIDVNTFVTGIGVYQMYQINKNIKSLN
jgi:hypothetical protein